MVGVSKKMTPKMVSGILLCLTPDINFRVRRDEILDR